MFGIGSTELLVIIVVAIVVLGPEHLPKVMRSITKAMSEFRKVSTDFQRTINLDAMLDEEDEKKKRAEAQTKKNARAKAAEADTLNTTASTETVEKTAETTKKTSAETSAKNIDASSAESTTTPPRKTANESKENPVTTVQNTQCAQAGENEPLDSSSFSSIEKLALLAEQQQQQGVERALAESVTALVVDSTEPPVSGTPDALLVAKNHVQEKTSSNTSELNDASSTAKESQGSLV